MTLSTSLFGLILAAVLAPAAAIAAPVTIKAGESWVFSLDKGEPIRAHRVASSAKPGPGQIKATVISTMGTTMTVSNNSRFNYTFRAELVGAGTSAAGKSRTCTLPANGGPVLEYWPVKAAAVRLSTFKVAPADGNCP
jgi:hypothetical protein